MTVYVREHADGTTEVLTQHDGKLYGLMLYFKEDAESKSAYDAACDHLIESLRF